MGFWRKLLALAVGAACAVAAAGHGFLAEPKARNVVHNSNYCPHCLAAGGPGVTYANGRVWPNALHGVCGDPAAGPLDHEAGGKFATRVITGRYVKGQRLTLRVKIEAPHGGRFSFGVCPVPNDASERKTVTQKCFDANRLINVADGTPYWWFGKRGTGEYTMDFRLPPNVTCKRCVLQWHYETGNSCTIPGTPQQHVMSPGMVPCDKSGNMEEFWNCADISIAEGPGGGGQPAPPPKKKAAAAVGIKERFAGPPADPAAALLTARMGALADLAFVSLVIAMLALALPVTLAASAAVGVGVWYVFATRLSPARLSPAAKKNRVVLLLPPPPPQPAWLRPVSRFSQTSRRAFSCRPS